MTFLIGRKEALETWAASSIRKAALCGDHFKPEMFNTLTKNVLDYPRLIKDAIPEAFQYCIKDNYNTDLSINEQEVVIPENKAGQQTEFQTVNEQNVRVYSKPSVTFIDDDDDRMEWADIEPPLGNKELLESFEVYSYESDIQSKEFLLQKQICRLERALKSANRKLKQRHFKEILIANNYRKGKMKC